MFLASLFTDKRKVIVGFVPGSEIGILVIIKSQAKDGTLAKRGGGSQPP